MHRLRVLQEGEAGRHEGDAEEPTSAHLSPQQDKTAKKKKKKRSSLNCFKGVDRAVENVLVARKPPKKKKKKGKRKRHDDDDDDENDEEMEQTKKRPKTLSEEEDRSIAQTATSSGGDDSLPTIQLEEAERRGVLKQCFIESPFSKTTWILMPHHSGGGVCSVLEEKAGVIAQSDGFYFCSSIYEDDEGKTCMRTSELIEISSHEKKSRLESWPLCSSRRRSPPQITCFEPTAIFANTGKRDNFLRARLSKFVPAAPFFKGFLSFIAAPPQPDLSNLIPLLRDALSEGDVAECFRHLLAFLDVARLAGFAVQRQFPVVVSSLNETDSKRGQYAADLAIFVIIKGVPVPVLICEFKSLKLIKKRTKALEPKQALEGARAQGLAYFDLFMKSLEENSIEFCDTYPCFIMTVGADVVVMDGVIRSRGGDIARSKLYETSDFNHAAATGINGLYAGLKAVSKLVAQFREVPTMEVFPVVTQCQSVSSIFYKKPLSEKVFEATAVLPEAADTPQPVIVKFLKGISYPEKFHRRCFENNIAPPLLAHVSTELYTMVVMGKVEGTTLHSFLNDKTARIEKAKAVVASLENALSFFNRQGFVHGDFRDTNIVVTEDGSVRIIDLDWACKESEGRRYPLELNHHIAWPSRKGKEMKMIHDQYFLAGHKSRLGRMIRAAEDSQA